MPDKSSTAKSWRRYGRRTLSNFLKLNAFRMCGPYRVEIVVVSIGKTYAGPRKSKLRPDKAQLVYSRLRHPRSELRGPACQTQSSAL